MTTAARQAAEAYALGITHGEIDRKFLAGWNAAIERAARLADESQGAHVPEDGVSIDECGACMAAQIAAAIRAERNE